MKIKRVRRYRHARYPKGQYRARVRPPKATKGASALLLLALTEACEDGPFGTGQTGPPPVMPEMVTEAEARQLIKQVFTANGIQLQDDFPLVFRWAADSLAFDVDGFNDSLQVGFEYVSEEEWGSFLSEPRAALADAAAGEGPHISVLGPQEQWEGYDTTLEAEVQAFIDLLRAQGII